MLEKLFHEKSKLFFGLLRVLYETCSEAKQAVSKHSRTSPEQNADLMLVVA
jgi:hypothetical protein